MNENTRQDPNNLPLSARRPCDHLAGSPVDVEPPANLPLCQALVLERSRLDQLSGWLEQRINEIEQSAKAGGSS